MSIVSRADLLRVLVAGGEAQLADAAARLGMRAAPPKRAAARRARVSGPPAEESPPPTGDGAVALAPTRLLRVVRVTYHEDQPTPEAAPTGSIQPLTEAELAGRPRTRPPASPPWGTWADYGPGLQRALCRQTGLGALDVDATLAAWTRCEHVDPLPRRPTLGVERPIWVLLDRSRSTRPFWREQVDLLVALARANGARLVRMVLLDDGPWSGALDAAAGPDDLALGVSEFVEPAAWAAFGRALLQQRLQPLAFSFSGRAAPAPWRNTRAREAPPRGAERALAWLAYASIFDVGHLRAVCRALALGPAGEVAVWNDRRVVRGKNGLAWLAPHAVAWAKAELASLPPDEQRRAIALQSECRDHHRVEVLAEEYMALRDSGRAHHLSESVRRKAEAFVRRLARTIGDPEAAELHPSVRQWVRRTEGRVSRDVFAGRDDVGVALQQLWWRANEEAPDEALPKGLDPAVAAAAHRSPKKARTYALFCSGAAVRAVAQEGASEASPTGSWLSPLSARRPVAQVRASQPPWAMAAGEDSFGRWAAFEVNGVRQTMRWIEPGEFLMGSPDADPEALNREKPQHPVTISDGFWLADTPCTQALWTAVMVDNPSRHSGEDRPVESVSHDDVGRFFARLAEIRPDLALLLPTEAQWEYACRAGSTAPRYGELDDIAWFNGNAKAPQPVAQKAPNAWGVYDMLGNVDEWCADVSDGYHDLRPYAEAPEADPLESGAERPSRVVRGGSWDDHARFCRAASRLAYLREVRYGSLGFRFARGRAAEPLMPAEPEDEPRGTRAAQSSAATTTLSLDGQARLVIEGGGPATIETDLVRLDVEPLERPDWAHGVGQDRFGLFADVELEATAPEVMPVSFRMRWIPPGRFWMGSPEGEVGRFDNEGPRHLVTLTEGFWIAATPCTQRLWTDVRGAESNPSTFKSADRPVDTVSFDEASEFLTQLNGRIPGLHLRLPTEAEWEYACRAGTTTATYAGDLTDAERSDVLQTIAWYGDNSHDGFELARGQKTFLGREGAGTHPVGGKQPNAWGVYDMLGNVEEWCADGADDQLRPYPDSPEADPPRSGAERPRRVVRGGSWRGRALFCRAACRLAIHREVRYDYLGFRFARGRAAEPETSTESTASPAGRGVVKPAGRGR